MNQTVWWIRRDLRLYDNQALHTACSQSDQVIPLFILDDRLLRSQYAGKHRIAFLFEGLRNLENSLRQSGSYLVVRRGDPLTELSRMVEQTQASRIIAEVDYSPFARHRDGRISSYLPVEWINGTVIHPPGSILKADGTPYTIFTPFLKAWKASIAPGVSLHEEKGRRINTPAGIPSTGIPDHPRLDGSIPFLSGEKAARANLDSFISGLAYEMVDRESNVGLFHQPVYRYSSRRDLLSENGTSYLSPYLRFGMISIRQVVSAALEAIREAPNALARQSAETWMNELVWREFYYHILDLFPQVRKQNFRLKEIQWENNERDYSTWCKGETGYPIVDAAMQQMQASGWMHNRARMIVASFLTKDLLVDWRWGEKFFMQHLIDGDPASNNGGWQWTAGTGTDAAPYFRIFNPITQSKKFDPTGNYIRRWLPELANIPDEYIHEPSSMPKELQIKVGCVIGKDYPAPIVNHQAARERALQRYRQKK